MILQKSEVIKPYVHVQANHMNMFI